jgi:AraC-like DNA-binding protein
MAVGQKMTDRNLEKLIDDDHYDSAKFYLRKQLKPFDESNSDTFVYYNARASFVYLRLGVLDSAMYFSKNAIKKLDYTAFNNVKHESWKSIAYCFTKYGQLDSAVVYTRKLFEAVEHTNNYEMKRYANLLMGIISFQNNLLDDSLDYYKQALWYSQKAKKTTNYKVDYYNLGLTSTFLQNYETGITYLTKAEQYALKGNDKKLLARIYGTTADNYFKQNNNEKRTLFLEKANLISKSINDSKLIAMGASHQMQWDLKQGNTDKAFKEGTIVLQKLKNEDLPQLEAVDDSLMYVMAKKKKQGDLALYYLESFTAKKLKLLKLNGRKQLDEIQTKYELKNKNLTIAQQKIVLVASERMSKIIFLILLVVSLVLAFMLFVYYKNKSIVHVLYSKEKQKDAEMKTLLNRIHAQTDVFSVLDNYSGDIVKDNKYLDVELNNKNKIEILFEKITIALEHDKLFLKVDLDQKDVIQKIATNKKYFYQAISVHSDLNFRGLVNRLRITEAKHIMENKVKNSEEINLSLVFTDSGFNSNTSFYRTFKKITGITPADYVTEFRKDLNKGRKT